MKILESLDGSERVLIIWRADGAYAYRSQWRSSAPRSMFEEPRWCEHLSDCGIYDSADTAETEARQRTPWLRALFH